MVKTCRQGVIRSVELWFLLHEDRTAVMITSDETSFECVIIVKGNSTDWRCFLLF